MGNLNRTTAQVEAALDKADSAVQAGDLAKVATSGSYNDLSNKPTIPSAVTESTVSGWGFTKNAGTITGVSANGTSVATSGVANIPAASTSAYGVTKLTSSTSSTSTTLAATASAVKAAYDLANSKGTGTVTAVKLNGTTYSPSGGVVDLGTISGGSGGGSAAYPIVEHGIGDTTFALTPNTLHRWGTVTSLSLTLASGTDGVVNEYMAEFFSGDTATALALPDNISWANDTVITVDANYLYQISILDNVAAWIKGKKMEYFYVKDTAEGITHGPFPYAVGDTADNYVYEGSKGQINKQTGGLSIYINNGYYNFLSSGKLESKTYTMSSSASGEPK